MLNKLKQKYYNKSIQFVILSSISLVSIILFLILAVIFTNYAENMLENFVKEKKEQQTEVLAESMERECKEVVDFFDTVYYKIIKKEPLQSESFNKLMDFVCDENDELIGSLVLYNENGEIIYENQGEKYINLTDAKKDKLLYKSSLDIGKTWFEKDIQFDDILIYRFVEININGDVKSAILVCTLPYERIEQVFQVLEKETYGYSYIKTQEDDLLYHPKNIQISHNVYKENIGIEPITEDGEYEQIYNNKKYLIRQRTMGYIGWKIISVSSIDDILYDEYPITLLIWCLFTGLIIIALFINRYIVHKITSPIQKLSETVEQFDDKDFDNEIKIDGTYEVRYLSESFNKMRKRIKQLMIKAIQKEQEYWDMKMKLMQSQINPHFLYNTLDSIIWMIESKRYDGASKMVSSLALFFRTSLNKGEDFITIGKELTHVESYMEIQGIRFEDKFSFEIESEESIKKYMCPKLIIQPLAENAVYHGMEGMYGDGEIIISVYEKNEKIYIDVIDNGEGMTEEQIEHIMNNKIVSSRRGSGIGVRNVDERLKLCFGNEYGITITSEIDEGTKVSICIPKVEDLNEYWKTTKNSSNDIINNNSFNRSLSVETTTKSC